jgi:hypothetical protein
MPTPPAELAHLDAIRIVPPVLVCLVVAALALLASEGHRDSNFSACHTSGGPAWAGGRRKKDRAAARGDGRIAPDATRKIPDGIAWGDTVRVSGFDP